MSDHIRIAVCEDLEDDKKQLVTMLEEYLGENNLPADISTFLSGEEFLQSNVSCYSLVFFDIYMGELTGVETARRLKAISPDCTVIFTTTSREYGADAFDLDAFHYLVKPLDKDKLFSVLNRWYNILSEVRTLTFKCGRTTREVYIRDIMYIDVLGRNSTIHTVTEEMEAACSLSTAEEMLPAGEFIRPIRYCLVSLRHIASISEEAIILSNGKSIRFSRRERANIRSQLAAYRLRNLRRR